MFNSRGEILVFIWCIISLTRYPLCTWEDREEVSTVLNENVHSIMVDRRAEDFEETLTSDESHLNHLWEEYWLDKGEQIIWASWVEKYKDYISLEYIENLSTIRTLEEVKAEDHNLLPALIDNLTIMENYSSTTETKNSNGTLDTIKTTMEQNEFHQLGSHNNINETAKHSDGNTVEEVLCNTDDTNNADQRWQNLWIEHCGEQYQKSYSEFISKKRKTNDPQMENTDGLETSNAIADEESHYSFGNEYIGEMFDLGLPTAFGRRKNVKERHQIASVDDSLADSDKFDDTDQFDAKKSKRKRSKKKKRQSELSTELPDEIANDKTLIKYWSKRFSLFSLFDLGIKLDKESWFSVTPEKIAAYTASRCKCDVIVDAFCGAGGNTIQFAKTCRKVIAIDIDPVKVKMAKHNASVYGVADKIEFIVGNYIDLADTLIADAVFLSPPWGGPEYLKNDIYDIEEYLIPVPASKLMAISRRISSNICIYLPRNSNKSQLSVLAGPGNSVEVNQEFLGPRLIAITAYYGNLLRN